MTLNCGISKTVPSRDRLKPWFFVTFNIIISLIFPENFIEISQVFQKIWRFSPSILTIFINFSDFLIFPCYKETNDVNILQLMSACFYFLPTLNRLLNNCVKLYWYYINSSWNMKVSNWPHPQPTLPEKSTLKKPSLNWVEMSPFIEEITVQVRVVLWSCLSPHPVFIPSRLS